MEKDNCLWQTWMTCQVSQQENECLIIQESVKLQSIFVRDMTSQIDLRETSRSSKRNWIINWKRGCTRVGILFSDDSAKERQITCLHSQILLSSCNPDESGFSSNLGKKICRSVNSRLVPTFSDGIMSLWSMGSSVKTFESSFLILTVDIIMGQTF